MYPRRERKYGNIKCSVDGFKFDSKKEARRYKDLKLLEQAGLIRNLRLQPKYPLVHKDLGSVLIKGERRNTTARYTADFEYTDKHGCMIVEDVKSRATMTEAAKLRIAIFELLYDLEVKLIF